MKEPSPSPLSGGAGSSGGKNPVIPPKKDESRALLYRFNAALWPNQQFLDSERRKVVQRSPQEGVSLEDHVIDSLDSLLATHTKIDSSALSARPFVATTAIVTTNLHRSKDGKIVNTELLRVFEISPDFSRVRIEDYGNADDSESPQRIDYTIEGEDQKELENLVNSARNQFPEPSEDTKPE